MTESSGRRVFHEDIFAEENENFSWQPLRRLSNSVSEVQQYDIHASKDLSNSPSSEDDLIDRGGDSTNSLKKSFPKHGSSSASDGNGPEDLSSSPGRSRSSIPHERVLPSIYDDDAQSGISSGVFEKKDLAFQSSFKKEFNTLPGRNFGSSLVQRESAAGETSPSHDKEKVTKRPDSTNRSSSPISDHRRDSKDKLKSSSSYRSRSKSKDLKPRARSRSRSRSKEVKHRSPGRRSRSRERVVERRRHSKSGRSRSPRNRRSRSRDSRRRSRSRDSRRRSRSRDSRRRSRSRSYDRYRRQSRRRSSSRDKYRRRRYSRSRSRSRDRSRGSGSRKLGSLPLSGSGGAITPQMALQQTMAAMSAKAQAMTGIALPKYYNPAAVNPLKYAEQVQKRKLLWQTKEKEVEQPKNTVWDKLTFDQDQDGKMTAKFRKLMGIKSDGVAEVPEPEDKESVLKKQAELFHDLDKQYEMARVTTHTQRGVGLGYSATTLYPPVQK